MAYDEDLAEPHPRAHRRRARRHRAADVRRPGVPGRREHGGRGQRPGRPDGARRPRGRRRRSSPSRTRGRSRCAAARCRAGCASTPRACGTKRQLEPWVAARRGATRARCRRSADRARAAERHDRSGRDRALLRPLQRPHARAARRAGRGARPPAHLPARSRTRSDGRADGSRRCSAASPTCATPSSAAVARTASWTSASPRRAAGRCGWTPPRREPCATPRSASARRSACPPACSGRRRRRPRGRRAPRGRRPVSSTSSAPRFSSRRSTRFVPGIGTTSSPLREHPRERELAGRARRGARATASTCSTSARLRLEVLALEARDAVAAAVALAEVVERADLCRSGSRGRAGGRRRSRCRARGRSAGSRPRVARSTASTRSAAPRSGAPRRARRIVSGAASERPRYRTLPACDQLGHRADGLLDRHLRVDAVLVVEVDRVDAEPLAASASQALRTYSGVAADAEELAVRRRARCRTWSRSATARRAGSRIAAADELLVVNGPYMSAVSRKVTPSSSARWIVRDRLALVGGPVELGHPHAAEAERSRFEAVAADAALCRFESSVAL